jgi:predicted Fe-Mo cluster-binding NifX family protein
MKIAVSSTGPNLDAQVDPRFGRAQYLLIVDIESLEFEAVENPNVAAGGGAGIQTAQMIASKGAEAVVTGNCGPNAYQTLAAAGIGVHIGASGTVREAVERFKRGEFQAALGPSVPSHFGTGGGTSGAQGPTSTGAT